MLSKFKSHHGQYGQSLSKGFLCYQRVFCAIKFAIPLRQHEQRESGVLGGLLGGERSGEPQN
jgi:hypothetical protein